jgi:hypothetical protein
MDIMGRLFRSIRWQLSHDAYLMTDDRSMKKVVLLGIEMYILTTLPLTMTGFRNPHRKPAISGLQSVQSALDPRFLPHPSILQSNPDIV